MNHLTPTEGCTFSGATDKTLLNEGIPVLLLFSISHSTRCLLFFPGGFVQSLHRPMLEVLGLVDLHYVVGALLLVVAVMGVLAGHLRHHMLLQVRYHGASVSLHASVLYLQTEGSSCAKPIKLARMKIRLRREFRGHRREFQQDACGSFSS